jgi:hypothetical protein
MKKTQTRLLSLITLMLVLVSGLGVTLTMTPWRARAASTIPVTNKTGGGHQDVVPSAVVQTQSSFAPVTVAELISAINTANSNNANDVIDLGGQTFTLTAVGDTTLGANGLPAIQSDNGHKLVIENGRVERSTAGGTAQFRLFYISPGTNLTLNRVTIANGAPPNTGIGRLGGGLFNQGTLTLNDCTVSGNFAIGGGIYNRADASAPSATVTLNRCTISGNSGDSGGGISNESTGTDHTATLVVANSTIAGNSSGHGGGIFNISTSGGTATMTLRNSTIAGNSTFGGGIGGGISNSDTASIGGCLIARNSAMSSPDVEGSFTSLGFNLVGDASGSTGFNRTGDQTGTQAAPLDPGLELDAMNKPLLKDNGGPTRTIALLAGSPALDKGRISGRFSDQRGVSRPMDDPAIANFTNGDGTDIGAFEAITCGSGSTVVSNTDDSGEGSLRCAIASAFSGSTITFNLTTPATINLTSDQLIIDKGVTIQGPGANLLTVQRSTAEGTPDFRIFEIKTMAPVVINGLTIANGKATGIGFASTGGGIFNRGGVLTLNDCAVSGNLAANGAAGIANFADAAVPTTMLTLNRCTISGNSGVGNGIGGGIQNSAADSGSTATLVVANSTIAGNSAGFGGGISNFANRNTNTATAALTINNSTITGNSASFNGGGIFDNSTNSVSIGGCLIARNSAQQGGPDVYNPVTSQGFNFIGDASGSSGSFNQPTDQTGIDPKLELDGSNQPLLKDNGGPTPTIALLCGSPAIDKGKNFTSATTDQRGAGFPRIFDNSTANASDGTDIGAFELQTRCNQPPVAQCHNVTISAGANCTASASINNNSFDPDAGDSISVTQSPAGPYVKGTTTVTLTVTDNHGASATCQATVTVLDSTAPTITCNNIAAQSVNTDGSCSALVPDVTGLIRAQSSDNCTPQASLNITQSPTSGSTISGTGSHPITVTVKDVDNNETTCVVGFTLNDTTAPTINCPANITKSTDLNQCAALVSFAPTATDNCSGVGTPTCTPPSGSSFPKGATTVTCTVKDAANNQSAPCSFSVTVNDTQPPSIACTANISVPAASGQCGATVSYNAPMVSDNCPGVGAPLCTPPSGTTFAKGTTTVNCTVKDAANNQSACSFTVTVVDTQAPTIVCPVNIITNTVNAGDASVAVTFAAPSAADNCSGVNVACVPPSGSMLPRGVTTVTCTATDASSNQTSCAFTVKVFDYVIVDDSNGRILRFLSTTGEYDFFDCRKSKSLSGQGQVTISSCKTELRDSKPDRTVTVLTNPCTKAGNATLIYQGTTYALSDTNLSGNPVKCP